MDKPKRFNFSPLQAQAVIGANKVNTTTKKYIETLSRKILELSEQATNLRKKAESLDQEVRTITQEINLSEKEAASQYQETLQIVMEQFETPSPPWKASVVLDKGLPIAVEIFKEEAQTA